LQQPRRDPSNQPDAFPQVRGNQGDALPLREPTILQ